MFHLLKEGADSYHDEVEQHQGSNQLPGREATSLAHGVKLHIEASTVRKNFRVNMFHAPILRSKG